MADIFKIKAKLSLYSTEKSGRKTGIKSGYRPNHVFEYNDETFQTYIGEITFDDKDLIMPNETSIVNVQFLNILDIRKFIVVGQKWWIHEGSRKVGEAKIIEIVK